MYRTYVSTDYALSSPNRTSTLARDVDNSGRGASPKNTSWGAKPVVLETV